MRHAALVSPVVPYPSAAARWLFGCDVSGPRRRRVVASPLGRAACVSRVSSLSSLSIPPFSQSVPFVRSFLPSVSFPLAVLPRVGMIDRGESFSFVRSRRLRYPMTMTTMSPHSLTGTGLLRRGVMVLGAMIGLSFRSGATTMMAQDIAVHRRITRN